MKVGICIVFYKDLQHIERLANSLKQLDYTNFEIFYTDNNPEKIHKEYFKSQFPEAFYIESIENTGFAKGNNQLAKEALKNKCDYIWVLNPDMAPRPNCLSELVSCLLANKNTEAAGPVLLYGEPERNKLVQFGGCKVNFTSQKKYAIHTDIALENLPTEQSVKVDLINGGSLLIKAMWLIENELFNEDYFMYNDELDLMNRIKNNNKDVRITFKAICEHHHDWSRKNKNSYYLMYYYMMRNKVLYWRKNNYSGEIVKSFIEYTIKFPAIAGFCLKTAGIGLIYYYYLGLFHGYLGKKGKAQLFDS